MRSIGHSIIVLLGWLAVLPAIAISGTVNIHDTKLLSQPAVSSKNIAFVYADDVWVADLDGKNVRRLTSAAGVESNPVFSPDGKHIAFSGQYDGNTDVYLVSVEGGVPNRLTWHPNPDTVRAFTPDGKAVLFSSPRNVFTRRYTQFFTVPVDGGFPTQLAIPNGHKASYSPDGSRLAYTPLAERFDQWKNYRGGTVTRIWLYQFGDHAVEQLPQPEGRCNDSDPVWVGSKVFFRSDRNGEFNIFTYDVNSKKVDQVTRHKDFPVLGLDGSGNNLVYEQAGHLHLLDISAGQAKKLAIGVAADLVELRPRFVKGGRYVRNFSISPSGARAVFEFRGEIVTLPAEKGDPRYLTQTTNAHERSPIWSPDGKSIAYFSDESGEYLLHVESQDGKGEVRKFKLEGAGFYELPLWSPDSQKISYVDNSQSLYWIDLKTKKAKKIASEPVYGPMKTLRHVWSPDSKWIAYTLGNKASIQTLYAYSIENDKSQPITDGMSEVSEPAFDAGGKYLYFLASTDAGPVKQWFSQASADMSARRSIYLAVLRKDLPSPLAKESDEEKQADEKEKEVKKEESEDSDDGKERRKGRARPRETKPPQPVQIDFDGMEQRILALPVPAGSYTNLQAGAEGQIYYIEAPEAGRRRGPAAGGNLHRFDLERRRDETILSGVSRFDLTPDGRKLLYAGPQDSYAIVATNAPAQAGRGRPTAESTEDREGRGDGRGDATPAQPGRGRLNVDAIEVRIDPPAEWKQIFDEAWRINRDYFYAPNMHGADWNASKTKYAAFLPHLATRGDLNRVIGWMCSELAVGHHRVGGGDRLHEPKNVPGGLLGADYSIENGRYRFKKVLGGLNWNPDLRAPLTAPGVNVKAGEYLLAVQGKELRPPANLYSLFENTAGKAIEMTVAPNADGTGSRTVTVEPIDDESSLRNRDWVESNMRLVHRATGGRVAYVYVPDTAGMGHTYFKRYFFPQADKEAIIVDERFNGGGSVADYYIDLLRRPFTAYWATRYGDDIKTPGAAIHGPKVMIIDETAGSGGDLLPWMFRKYQLGPLVGKRTWGGLVGILGFPTLMDGGSITAPNLAIWTEEGFVVENEGVPPDIDVEQWPADVAKGKDPQLEKAIEVVMAELAKNPSSKPKRPPYPVRARQD